MERYRLFVAIDLPEEAKASLAGLGTKLTDARRVPAEQLHLTLRFIGDVDAATLEEIKTALGAITCRPFPLEVRGVGHFPRSRFPRVFWVGVEPSPLLMQLQQEVELAVQTAGIPAEARPFSPHITIARLKDPSPGQLHRFEEERAGFDAGAFTITAFHLYASTLSAAGAIHIRLQSYPL